MTKIKIYVLLSVLIILAQSAHGFQLPTYFSTELARYSNISTTSTCTDGGPENCNTTCPTRTSFPSFTKPIKSIFSKCTVYNGSPPTHSDIGNGGIEFNSSTTNCPLHEEYYKETNQHFTITMWVKVSTSTNVLSIGSGLNLKYDRNAFVLNTSKRTVSPGWYFITLRFNGKLSWFLNGQLVADGLSFTASTSYSVKLGPGQVLTSSLILVDVRWYSDVITDREIEYLNKGLDDNDFCRCPPTHPKVVKDILPVKNMKCTDGSSEVLRLGENAHNPEYMADANATTKWVSGTVNEVNITLTLKTQFQIKRLSLIGIAKPPASLNAILLLNNAEVQAIRLTVTGGKVSYDFEEGSITSRTQYQKFIANKVIVQAKFSTNDYLTVSELTLEARCSCYGNDNACRIVKDGYTCSCLSSSNTNGTHCHACGTGYFRSAEQFVCNNPCGCNMTGSIDTQCLEVDGQCTCHSNIEGKQCSVCKHNTVNFSDSGCTACQCNPDGITSCSDDLTCNCKQNVDITSGKCDKCLPNYYNISSPSGCAACECDPSGTRLTEPYCESGKGNCDCRANVEGKTCKTCKDEYYGLSGNKTDGCDACECNIVGSDSFICDKDTGQCPCFGESNHTQINNRQCIPTALKLEPLFGPKAGSTLLTLTGTLLGTNADVKLTIGGEEQTVVDRNLTSIVFRTKESTEIENKPIRLVWSYGSHTYSDNNFDNTTQMFEYKNNPQMIVPTLNLRTFASGGCIIQVGGDNLDSVPYPKLRLYLDGGKEIQSPCVATKKTLKCPTPTIDIDDKDRNVSYGFWLDGLMLYENVTDRQGSELEVVKDPSIYTNMSETFRNTFDNIFKVKGERLNDACRDSDDVSITLGHKICAILTRHDNVIKCDPGESFPGTARSVKVKVKIGNTTVVWGTLKINSFWTNTEFICIAIGAGVFLIIIVFFGCIIKCRRKGNSYSPDDSIPLEMGESFPFQRLVK
ncbi:usherin-like [Ruditapes philippinarum]|uniref:usherin-like n=1 Tax=Ruditapes philippinarum TaxID=129788 RepID=UPI00295B2D4D|nr:usherin-like [Ruditapes philippinarum]